MRRKRATNWRLGLAAPIGFPNQQRLLCLFGPGVVALRATNGDGDAIGGADGGAANRLGA